MRHRRLPLAALLVVVCAASFTGCNCGSSKLVSPPLPPLSAVRITPKTDTLVVGETRQFVAAAIDTNGVTVAGAAFDWESRDPNVFSVSGSGLVTALGEGVTQLVASAGGRADSDTVAVIVQRGWYAQASNTTNDLNGVCFLPDGRSGWAVGNAGTIVHTNDAGASWSTQLSGASFSLNEVWFTTSVTGFIVGNSGTVLRTRDGGASWRRLASVTASDNLFGVAFADTAHGCVVGANGTVLRTVDAGNSWTRANPTGLQLNGVSFSDTTNGWAVGETGVIAGTRDGGRSWYVVQPAVTALSLRSVWRSSDTTAVAVGAQGTSAFTSATRDSLQWNLGSLGATKDLESVQLVNPFVSYAVGEDGPGLVLRSSDGGATWTPQVSNAAQRLKDVWFVDALRGWAVGAGGRIIHTSKGGN